MDDIPTKEALLRQWLPHDPIIYACYTQAAKQGLADDAMWRLMVALMADRHAHMERVHKNLLAQIPSSMIVTTLV